MLDRTRTASRRNFLGGALAALAAAPAVAHADASIAPPYDHRAESALVLSGGGARGAYEAGVIGELVRAAGARDGERLAGVDIVCGTSIGALNGWFVATGQYSRLAEVWRGIAARDIVRLKRRYAAITRSSSGVLTRIVEALKLGQGLSSTEKGVLDGERIGAWIRENVDLSRPLLVPFAFTATDLTTRGGTLFYRLPEAPDGVARATALAALRRTAGADLQLREATDDILATALQASTTIPIALEPIAIDGPDGVHHYIDGGVAYNTPVDIARALAKRLRVVLVDAPASMLPEPRNCVEIGLASFQIAQRRLLDTALRAASLETEVQRALAAAAPRGVNVPRLYDVDIELLHPSRPLLVTLVDFDKQTLVDEAMREGAHAVRAGFMKYPG